MHQSRKHLKEYIFSEEYLNDSYEALLSKQRKLAARERDEYVHSTTLWSSLNYNLSSTQEIGSNLKRFALQKNVFSKVILAMDFQMGKFCSTGKSPHNQGRLVTIKNFGTIFSEF